MSDPTNAGGDTYVAETSTGAAVLVSVPRGRPAPAPLAAGKGVRPLLRTEDLPPASLSAAWRYAGSAAVETDLAHARIIRTAALTATASVMAKDLNSAAVTHLLDGDTATASLVRAAAKAVTATPDLSHLGTAAGIASYEPEIFTAARGHLAK